MTTRKYNWHTQKRCQGQRRKPSKHHGKPKRGVKIKDCEINKLKETNTSNKQKGKETVKQRKWRKTNNQKSENVNLQRKLKKTERENTDLKTETTRLQENNEDFGTRQDKTEQINDTLLKCYIEQTRKTQGQTKDIDQENKSPKFSHLETAEAEWLFVNTVYSWRMPQIAWQARKPRQLERPDHCNHAWY